LLQPYADLLLDFMDFAVSCPEIPQIFRAEALAVSWLLQQEDLQFHVETPYQTCPEIILQFHVETPYQYYTDATLKQLGR
jgi:hypothetical protein